MYHGMCIMSESDLVLARESANALQLIWKLLYQVISGPDGLGCFRDCSRLGCGCCSVEKGAGCVPGHLTMMAQFNLMTACFSLEGRSRMTGPGVSATYQYELPCGVECQGNLAAK